MENVVTKMEGTVLWIGVDTAKDQGMSQSGKTKTIANSGFASLPEVPVAGLGFKLNVWKKP